MLNYDSFIHSGFLVYYNCIYITHNDFSQVFKTTNPYNNRPGVEDVVILFTDGRPNAHDGTRKETKRALAELAKLREKKIQIIGIAIGEKAEKGKNLRDAIKFLEQAVSSPDLLFEADKSKMNAIMDTLIAASCKVKPGNVAVKMTKYQSKKL